MTHKLLGTILMFTLLFGVLPSTAFAEDDQNEISEEAEEAIDKMEEVIFGDEEGDDDDDNEILEEGGSETVVMELVAEAEIEEEVLEELEEAVISGDYPDKMYLSVQWGYFPAEGEVVSDMEMTDWTGDISFESSTDLVKARPVKLLHFEENQDYLDFEDVSTTNTSFVSMIYGYNDGILFKVISNSEDSEASIVFETEYSTIAAEVSLGELAERKKIEFDYNPYKVVMTVWASDDWIENQSNHRGQDSLKPKDAEQGSWYERYMNYSVDNGFFQGYKDNKGKLTGDIGPKDELTRFELLKVLYKLAVKLEMGVGAGDCDAETVPHTEMTDWMGDHWARGYVQCLENSGYEVTILDGVIAEDLVTGDESALRWEVIVTAFELLGIDTNGTADTDLDDVLTSGLQELFTDMIDKAVELGILSGYPDGSFKPFRQVNRAEMFKIVTLFYEVLSV